ncbi:MAG: hypothetical protein J6I56_03015 [Lachnospiraceae bacterium]|nr:hypothetical protein [Lachnospiraceae bacterium]
MKNTSKFTALILAALLCATGCGFLQPAQPAAQQADAWEEIPASEAAQAEAQADLQAGSQENEQGQLQEQVQAKPQEQEQQQEQETAPAAAQEQAEKEAAPAEGMPDDFYRKATSLSADDVEAFADTLKDLMLRGDIKALTGYISFPLTIDDVTYKSLFGLMGLDYSAGIRQTFIDALSAEDCREMTCTENGILMGENGEIRIQEVNGQLKVVEISGLLK